MNTKKELAEKRFKLHWMHVVFLMLIAVIGGSILVGIFVQSNPYLANFDEYFYKLIHTIPGYPWLKALIWPFNNNFIPIGGPYPSFFIVLNGLLLAYVYFFKRSLFLWTLLTLVIASILAGISLHINSEVIFRERPFTELPNSVSIEERKGFEGWTSYPSGHTRDTAMYATIFAAYIPQAKIPMIVLTLFVAFSRLYLGVHYPTDVIAGILFGFLIAKLTLILTRELQIIISKRKKELIHAEKPKQYV